MIRLPETSDDTFQTLVDFGEALGKTTVEAKVLSVSGAIILCVYLVNRVFCTS